MTVASSRFQNGEVVDHPSYTGMTIEDVARQMGISRNAAYDRLARYGYRYNGHAITRIRTVNEIEDEINARPVTYGPCFRCGGRVCECGGRG